ncbi:hypothetical protein D3C83_102660 [compost metagenome]
MLVHDRRRALAVLEILQRLQQLGLAAAGEAGWNAADAAPVVAVTGKTGGGEIARGIRVLRPGRCCQQYGDASGADQDGFHDYSPGMSW